MLVLKLHIVQNTLILPISVGSLWEGENLCLFKGLKTTADYHVLVRNGLLSSSSQC